MRRSSDGESKRTERVAAFEPEFREDVRHWVETNSNTALRLMTIVEAVMRDRFSGIGNPEPLTHRGPGVWSRRLTEEHRVFYFVSDDRTNFLQARYPY